MQLSSVEINNNGPATSTVLTYVQTFTLPDSFTRGNRVPAITGFQFCQNVTDPDSVTLSCALEVLDGTWTTLATKTVNGTQSEGQYVWIDVYFDSFLDNVDFSSFQFRVSINTNTPTWITDNGLRYRLLAATADSGEDFLGNQYRSVVVKNSLDNIDSRDSNDNYWLSKPNPSKFAVEALYFDLSGVEGRSTVFDRILLDPITPGVIFHVYYSDDGVPGTTDAEWDDRLWSPVAQTFTADRRQEHALAEPVVAKYVKIEFSHLQAQYYAPGTFAQPTVYKKFPKWVLDYFMAGLAPLTDDPFVARRVAVTYDAYDLAYNYYLDDLKQEPGSPNFETFMTTRSDLSDRVDPETLSRIQLSLKPYQQNPARLAKGFDYLLSMYTGSDLTTNYPVERVTPAKADTTLVSNLNRDSLVTEQTYPPMFFYLRARHRYREVMASFQQDRGYFVGIRELAFSRDSYSVATDSPLYVEPLADFSNTMRNDFIPQGPPPKKLGGSRV